LKSYKQIRAELDKLQREAESVRKTESAGVIAKMKKTIEEYGLTAADLGLDGAASAGGSSQPSAKTASKTASRKAPAKKGAAKKAGSTSAGVAKYRDPESGKSWSGFGRVPGWLAAAKDREAFRVGADAAPQPGPQVAEAPAAPEAAAPAPEPAAKKAAKKAGAKTAVEQAAVKQAAAKKASAKKAAGKKAAAKKAVPAEGAAADSSVAAEPAADQPAPPAAEAAPAA
jgi:DNA-binding protein H-NS